MHGSNYSKETGQKKEEESHERCAIKADRKLSLKQNTRSCLLQNTLEPTQCMGASYAPHYEKTKAEEPESHRPLSFLYNRTFSTKHTLAPKMVICTQCMGAIYTSPSQTSI